MEINAIYTRLCRIHNGNTQQIMHTCTLARIQMLLMVRTCVYCKLSKILLNQARAGHRPARAWFLEITFIAPKYVCVYVCVSTPEAINN